MSPREIDNPDAPPSEEEIRESERLRQALEKNEAHDGADFLRAVKNASAPRPLEKDALDAAVARALGTESTKRGGALVVRVTFGASVVLAAAAALLLLFGRNLVLSRAPAPAAELVRARSTQPLFVAKFDARGGESARIDRIALARASDLRENQFAKWGLPRDRGRK